VISWLPIFHDMGLVAGVLMPTFAGCEGVLLPPLAFLQDPLRWPRAVSRYQGSVSGAPSFAFEMCARALAKRGLEELDLSHWKVAFCGAEPVRADSLRRFSQAFEPHGFAKSSLFPCYGMAEATLFVSGGPAGEGMVNVVHPASGREVVACGRPAPGEKIAIVDPDSLAPVADSQIGEILVSGSNNAAGYWNLPDASDAIFRAQVRGDTTRRYLRTGDLGFIQGGRLAIAGRAKDLIIIRGENFHPEDIEASVAVAHPSLASGAGAAFSIETADGEKLVLVFEIARGETLDGSEIEQAVAAAVAEHHGIAVHELALIRLLTLPRTANGKVQRARCREAYLANELAFVLRLPGLQRNR
jgi:acyl-CoA synthetase (AMP-forming)/AMP-acid ligase II